MEDLEPSANQHLGQNLHLFFPFQFSLLPTQVDIDSWFLCFWLRKSKFSESHIT